MLFKHAVRFNLQEKNASKNKLVPIRCFVTCNSKKFALPTGVRVVPGAWTEGNQLSKHVKYGDYAVNKSALDNLEQWISKAFKHLTERDGAYPDLSEFRELCIFLQANDGKLPGEVKKPELADFLQYMEDMVKKTEDGTRVKRDGTAYALDSTKHYRSTLKALQEYMEYAKLKTLGYNDITVDFYYNFKDFCYKIKKFTDNYFGSHIKVIKTAMNEAKEKGMHNNQQYESRFFIKTKANVENTYLNTEQLQVLADHDFGSNTKLARARDLFLVGCWTGLRFSDFTKLNKRNVDSEFIYIQTQKTSEPVSIPIHPNLRAIMERYKDITFTSLPKPISNVNLNIYIKEAVKEAGLTELISLSKAKAGVKYNVQQPLYELIATHTARRSFATNMYKLGVPTLIIMGITGHSTEAAFMNYIKLGSKEKAEIMKEFVNRHAMKLVAG